MKRAAGLLMLALAIGFAAGAAARAKKFRYLSERWNQRVDMTAIELACLQSAYRACEPVTLHKGRLVATEIRADARATHIRVTVQVKRLGRTEEAPSLRELEAAGSFVYRYWREHLMRRTVPPASGCPVTIDLKEGSKVVYREIRDTNGRRGFQNPQI